MKETLKRIAIIGVIIFFFWFGLFYLLGSLLNWSFNFMEWNQELRFVCVSFSVIGFMWLFVIICTEEIT